VFLAARSTARSTWGHCSSFLPLVGTKVITRRLAVSTRQERTIDGALVVGMGMTATMYFTSAPARGFMRLAQTAGVDHRSLALPLSRYPKMTGFTEANNA
jgi:hypothetical protein